MGHYSANLLNCPHAQSANLSSYRDSYIIGPWDIAELGPFQNRRGRAHDSYILPGPALGLCYGDKRRHQYEP